LGIALDFMARRQDDSSRSRTLILSDILQSGWSLHELYRRVAQLVESRGITKLIGIGEDISSESKINFSNTGRFSEYLVFFLK
jgi:alanine racemase